MSKVFVRLKVCVLVDNIGPYHSARFNHLSKVFDLIVVERRSKSIEYSWIDKSSRYFQVKSLDGKKSFFGIYLKLREIFLANDFHFVLIPGWSDLFSVTAMAVCHSLRAKVVLMSDSQEIDAKRHIFFERLKTRYLKFSVGVFVAGESHRHYINKLSSRSIPTAVGYDVVDNDYFSTFAKMVRLNRDYYADRYCLPSNYFLVVARLIPKKNLLTLISAFARFKIERASVMESCDWQLVVVGDGEVETELRSFIKINHLEDSVKLHGFVGYEVLPIYYGLAKVFILPSSVEQWGLVVNEAMASSLPVLVSNKCGCSNDLVVEGENGFRFSPADTDGLFDLMLKFGSNVLDLEKMGEKSGELISKFSPQTSTANLHGLLKQCESSAVAETSFLDALSLYLFVFLYILRGFLSDLRKSI